MCGLHILVHRGFSNVLKSTPHQNERQTTSLANDVSMELPSLVKTVEVMIMVVTMCCIQEHHYLLQKRILASSHWTFSPMECWCQVAFDVATIKIHPHSLMQFVRSGTAYSVHLLLDVSQNSWCCIEVTYAIYFVQGMEVPAD